MKKIKYTYFFLLISMIQSVSAYIDPGTGGYLATTFGSYILAVLTVVFATIGAFFSKHFSVPIKKFIKKNNRVVFYSLVILLALVLAFGSYLYFLDTNNIVFDESLSGAHVYNSEFFYPGYNLYEGKLIDVNGNLIKNWSSIYLGVIDDNGDYYAQECYECPKWGRYTFDDEVIWEKEMPIHHEIVLKDDSVFTFTKEVVEYNERLVEFDVILEFDRNGTFKSSFSLWDNLKMFQQFHKPLELDSPPSFFIPEDHKKNKSIWGGEYDYYHLNAMSFLPSNALGNFTINNSLGMEYKPFQKGNWLISFRHGSMLYILDKDTKEVVWFVNQFSVEDEIQGQHSPFMLPNGNIIMFDNGRYREKSRVVVINPITLAVEWEYKAEDFFSLSQSYVQVLPGFNLLVTEAEEGHVFEMTPEKEIVWEFYHSDKQNENNSVDEESWGERQKIYRMTRYDKDFIDGLRWGE